MVSDAISPYGLKEGIYKWDKRVVYSEEGSCRLEDGTLAGSTVGQLKACQNLAQWSRDPSASIWSATVSPRFVLEPERKLDQYLVGKSLKHLLRWTLNTENNELSWQQAA